VEVKSVLINNSVSLNVKIHFVILILLHFISLITNNFSNNMVKVKVKQSRNSPGVAQKVPGGLDPQIFHDIRHVKVVRLSAPCTGRQECSWYSFSLGTESTPGSWYGRKKIRH